MRLAKRLAGALVFALASTIVALLIAAVALPALLGWVPLTVRSGSMEPTYPVGSQVVVAPVESDARKALAKGDVITFMPRPDDPTLVTHRIVAVTATSDGTVSYTTRGDANGASDPEPVRDFQVRAVVKYHVPYMGYVSEWVGKETRQLLIYGVVAALFAYAAYQLAAAAMGKKRKAPINV